MGFAETLKAWADQALKQRADCTDEYKVRNGLVVPFIHNVLHFDVFNVKEVEPEHLCAFGPGKTDRVDYAAFLNGKLVMIIECKGGADVTLNEKHVAQLKLYYAACETKGLVGMLTNGIEWQFLADSFVDCQMHAEPFLIFRGDNLAKKQDVDLLEMLTKPKFNKAAIIKRMFEMQRIKRVKDQLEEWLTSPPDYFVTLMAKRFEKGKIGPKIKARYRRYLKAAVRGYLDDYVEECLPATERARATSQKETAEIESDSTAITVTTVTLTPEVVEGPPVGGSTEEIKPASESSDGGAVEPRRKKIKAIDLVNDIKSGMAFDAIESKYRISSTKLAEFVHRLVNKGMLKNEDLPEQTL